VIKNRETPENNFLDIPVESVIIDKIVRYTKYFKK